MMEGALTKLGIDLQEGKEQSTLLYDKLDNKVQNKFMKDKYSQQFIISEEFCPY